MLILECTRVHPFTGNLHAVLSKAIFFILDLIWINIVFNAFDEGVKIL